MNGPEWFYLATGVVVALVGAAVVAWGLFAGRARGSRRCSGCWYSMQGLATLTCPECGRTARDERGLQRTRRRWRVVMVGVLVVVGGGVGACEPVWRMSNPWEVVPTWVLLRAEDVVGANVVPELTRAREHRIFANGLSDGQIRELVLRDERLLNVRTVWPDGVEFRGIVGGRIPYRATGDPTIDFYGRVECAVVGPGETNRIIEDLNSIVCALGGSYARSFSDETMPFRLVNGVLPVEIAFVEEKFYADYPNMRGRVVRVPIPIKLVDGVDQVIQPVSGEVVDQLVRKALSWRLVSENGWALFNPTEFPTEGTLIDGVTIAFTAQVQFRGQAVGETTGWTRFEAAQLGPGFPRFPLKWWGETPKMDPFDPDWTLVVRSDGAQALRDIKGTKYWKGSYTLPLSEVLK